MPNKNLIRAMIVDDEVHNQSILRTLLAKHCPEVNVIADADNADDAYLKIRHLEPQLVFLDIKMPGKSGFDMLKMFERINFEVVFVSAFNEFAITAFDFNALDYILKPIDHTKLIKAVGKAVEKVRSKRGEDNILHFIKTLNETTDLINKFSLHYNGKVVLVNVSDVSYLEANIDYVNLRLTDNSNYTSSKTLKQFEDVLRPLPNFLRINKSIIINIDTIKSYTKGAICEIELKGGQVFEISRRKKTEILEKLNKSVG